MEDSRIGKADWFDLTVANCDEVRDFYSSVIGWTHTGIDMDGYSDYCMMPAGTEDVTCGICHARGQNANIPPMWMIYFNVANLEKSLAEVVARGGKQLTDIREVGESGRFAFIQDPAGACCGLWQKGG